MTPEIERERERKTERQTDMSIVIQQVVCELERVEGHSLLHPLGSAGGRVWVEVHPARSYDISTPCYQPGRAVKSIPGTHTHIETRVISNCWTNWRIFLFTRKPHPVQSVTCIFYHPQEQSPSTKRIQRPDTSQRFVPEMLGTSSCSMWKWKCL